MVIPFPLAMELKGGSSHESAAGAPDSASGAVARVGSYRGSSDRVRPDPYGAEQQAALLADAEQLHQWKQLFQRRDVSIARTGSDNCSHPETENGGNHQKFIKGSEIIRPTIQKTDCVLQSVKSTAGGRKSNVGSGRQAVDKTSKITEAISKQSQKRLRDQLTKEVSVSSTGASRRIPPPTIDEKAPSGKKRKMDVS